MAPCHRLPAFQIHDAFSIQNSIFALGLRPVDEASHDRPISSGVDASSQETTSRIRMRWLKTAG